MSFLARRQVARCYSVCKLWSTVSVTFKQLRLDQANTDEMRWTLERVNWTAVRHLHLLISWSTAPWVAPTLRAAKRVRSLKLTTPEAWKPVRDFDVECPCLEHLTLENLSNTDKADRTGSQIGSVLTTLFGRGLVGAHGLKSLRVDRLLPLDILAALQRLPSLQHVSLRLDEEAEVLQVNPSRVLNSAVIRGRVPRNSAFCHAKKLWLFAETSYSWVVPACVKELTLTERTSGLRLSQCRLESLVLPAHLFTSDDFATLLPGFEVLSTVEVVRSRGDRSLNKLGPIIKAAKLLPTLTTLTLTGLRLHVRAKELFALVHFTIVDQGCVFTRGGKPGAL